MSVTVLGLDLSLTCTGWAHLSSDAEMWTCTTRTIKSRGKASDGPVETVRRLQVITEEVCTSLVDLVVIEGPSYGSRTGSQHERGGLWWQVAAWFVQAQVPVAVVSPNARAKYATGKGNAGKDAVLAAVVRRYGRAEIDSNDVADAMVLAAMGARWLGAPIEESLPKVNVDALAKVRWPDRLEALA